MTSPYTITRKQPWTVQSPDGSEIDRHNEFKEANETATNWCLQHARQKAQILGPTYEAVYYPGQAVEPPDDPAPIPFPTPTPEPTPPQIDPRPVHYHHYHKASDGPILEIPRDKRRDGSWVEVIGEPGSTITELNDISTPSLIRFKGVHLRTRPIGRRGGEFAYDNCYLDVPHGIGHMASKLWTTNCRINVRGKGGVFPRCEHYAVNNVLEGFQEDLFRCSSGYIDGLKILPDAFKPAPGGHWDMFEFPIEGGTANLTIKNVTGPDGSRAKVHGLRGLTGGNVLGVTLENIKADLGDSPDAIGAVNIGEDWIDVILRNFDLRGSSIIIQDDFRPKNFTLINTPRLEEHIGDVPGVRVAA